MNRSRSPRPRNEELAYSEWTYEHRSIDYLPHPTGVRERGFFAVLEERRSSRRFGPLARESLSALLWFTAKTRKSAGPNASRWEHRPVPSAGGRHPIDLLILESACESNTLHLYEPLAHALRSLRISDTACLERLRAAAAEAVRHREGVVIWHAAQFARTTSRYEHGESLVWRDAGALVAVTTLVAEALDLACCPLGISGEPYLSQAIGAGLALQGLGGCVVGGRIS